MRHSSHRFSTWLTGAALGAVAMYFSDPDRGRRRRAEVQDKARHMRTRASHAVDVAVRDLDNRFQGMRARVTRLLHRNQPITPVDDRTVAERVRAHLGRLVSNPRSIHVTAQEGRVQLRGPILAAEKESLLAALLMIPGVTEIQDELQVHESAEGIPGLQGAREREAGNHAWTPAGRGAAVLGGSALGMYGLARRSPGGVALAAAGLALLVKGLASSTPSRHAMMETGAAGASDAIELEKSIDIMAPPEAVFDAWANYENFPRFMSHVLEVRDIGQDRSHWVVRGPMETRVEWDSTLVENIRPSLLGWRSSPGATVENEGTVRFTPIDGGTRATVRLVYRPPAGVVGHEIAVLFGADPKREMDEDLARMKRFIEERHRPPTPPEAEQRPILH